MHVPTSYASGETNLDIGLKEGIWGWQEGPWESLQARRRIQSLVVGQPLMIFLGGPGRAKGSWTDEGTPFKRVVAGVVTRTVYYETTEVWPDHSYPYRIRFDILRSTNEAGVGDVDHAFWEAVRLCCCGPSPQFVEIDWEIETFTKFVANLPGADTSDESNDVAASKMKSILDGVIMASDGTAFDRTITTTGRLEADFLRSRLVGSAPSYMCDLCDRDMPTRLIMASHIKKRSDCSDQERGDPKVVMGNCLLGCDILYELGVITVGPEGIIEEGVGEPFPGYTFKSDSSLGQAMTNLIGKKCQAFSKETQKYFAWHFERHGGTHD